MRGYEAAQGAIFGWLTSLQGRAAWLTPGGFYGFKPYRSVERKVVRGEKRKPRFLCGIF
jgi:hypothetical protein